ncbi:MAG: hypothetical protein Q4D16_19730 [Eubacteriales bacterium]|nr:hypothetical protein [Eubacteriales bacterium]
MATVIIKTRDGKVYTNPADIHIPRSDETAMFYRIVDEHNPKQNAEEKTA